MVAFLLLWTAGMVMGSLLANRRAFADYLMVQRYRAFVRTFPDHPVVQWHDEELTEKTLAEKKSDVLDSLGAAGAMLIWPVAIPVLVTSTIYNKLHEKNQAMTNIIVIDHARIREEEGR